jgi:hypothetical protein
MTRPHVGAARAIEGALARTDVVWLKRTLIAAWALWLTVVTLSNALDALKALGVPGADWSFASGNYTLVAQAMALYALPGWVVAITFAGVIAWEGAATGLFWWAAARYRGGSSTGLGRVYAAFAAVNGLWFAFLHLDEVLLQYLIPGAHRDLLIASLASLLVVGLLPERPRAAMVSRPCLNEHSSAVHGGVGLCRTGVSQDVGEARAVPPG